MDDWQQISTAPYNQEVEVLVLGKPLRAALIPEGSLNSDEKLCDQWVAAGDDYPECWTDGACWESNGNEMMSAQPEAWRPLQERGE